MLHFHPTYKDIAKKRGYKADDIKKGKDFMKIYLQQAFAIEKPFALTRSTAKLFYKALQTQQIAIRKELDYDPSELLVEEYIKGVVLEENSPEIVDFIAQLVLSFFTVRGREQKIVEEFNQYYSYLMNILQLQPRLV